jgi:hypothetical protein
MTGSPNLLPKCFCGTSTSAPIATPGRTGASTIRMLVRKVGPLGTTRLTSVHIAKPTASRVFSTSGAQAHHLVGHRWSLIRSGSRNPPYREFADNDREVAARYSAMTARGRRLRYRRATLPLGARPPAQDRSGSFPRYHSTAGCAEARWRRIFLFSPVGIFLELCTLRRSAFCCATSSPSSTKEGGHSIATRSAPVPS